jgi:hypothetical protein
LEDDAVAGIRLFKDSGNDLIYSDSGSVDNYTEHAQNTKKSVSLSGFPKNLVYPTIQGCVTTHHTVKQYRNF